MIYRWKHQGWKCHVIGFMQGFAEIADGLVTVCSLGFYASGFALTVACYRSKKFHQRRRPA